MCRWTAARRGRGAADRDRTLRTLAMASPTPSSAFSDALLQMRCVACETPLMALPRLEPMLLKPPDWRTRNSASTMVLASLRGSGAARASALRAPKGGGTRTGEPSSPDRAHLRKSHSAVLPGLCTVNSTSASPAASTARRAASLYLPIVPGCARRASRSFRAWSCHLGSLRGAGSRRGRLAQPLAQHGGEAAASSCGLSTGAPPLLCCCGGVLRDSSGARDTKGR